MFWGLCYSSIIKTPLERRRIMTENDLGVAVPDPRNIYVSHLDATQPENELLVAEGVLSPPQPWRQRHKFTIISLGLTAAAFASIILGILISLSALNDTGQPLGTLGLVLFGAAIVLSIVAMFKEKTVAPAWVAFAIATLPVLSLLGFSIFLMVKINAALGG